MINFFNFLIYENIVREKFNLDMKIIHASTIKTKKLVIDLIIFIFVFILYSNQISTFYCHIFSIIIFLRKILIINKMIVYY